MKKKKKAETVNKVSMDKKIIHAVEELLQNASAAEYRRALMDLYFEATIVVQDKPLEFSMLAYRIQLVVHFFEAIDEKKITI